MADSPIPVSRNAATNKLSMMPDWVITVGGYACFAGALAAEGLVMVYEAVTGKPPEKLPAPLGSFMAREP